MPANLSPQHKAAWGGVTQPTAFEDRSAFSAAYERRLQEIRSVPDEELIPLNIDVHNAITTVLGSLPEIQALHEAMTELPGLDQARVTGLEDYAQAAAEAHSRYVTATLPPEDIVPLKDEAMGLRETFRSDATALANRGLIERERLAPFKGLVGYKNVGFDLIDWANLMRDCWSVIQGKTALSASEIQQAKDVGERLVRAAGLREQAPAVVADAAHVRQQAMTLLILAYDETRRAVGYLRWHPDDAATIAPSLYGGRTRHRDDAQPVTSPEPQPPPDPVPPVVTSPATPVNGTAPGMPVAIPGAAA